MEEQKLILPNKIRPKSGSYNYKLIIPEYVEHKIKFTCNKIPDKEWSGILFYTYSGSFTDNDLSIQCEDFVIMDVGSATHTEFDINPEIISYMTDNGLLECQMALIHSHNRMESFFSTEDISTLYKEGIDRNNFVSLIVNNAGNYTAAITRRIKEKELKESVKYDFFDKGEIHELKEDIENEDYVEWFLLNIVKENSKYDFTELEERIKELNKTNKNIFSFNNNYTSFVNTQHNDTDDFNVFVNPDILKSLVTQLITCSLVVSKDSKIAINKWINSMPILFSKRFGKGEEGLKTYRDWVSYYIEFLTWNIKDDYLTNKLQLEQDEIQSIYSKALIEELSKFETNDYLNICLDELERYIIV